MSISAHNLYSKKVIGFNKLGFQGSKALIFRKCEPGIQWCTMYH